MNANRKGFAKFGSYLLAAMMASVSFSASGAGFSSRIQELQDKLEQRVKDQLHVFLPDDLRLAVSVRVEEDVRAPAAPKGKPSGTFDFGYVPIPVSEDFAEKLAGSTAATETASRSEDLNLKSVSVDIAIPRAEDSDKPADPAQDRKTTDFLAGIVKKQLAGLNPAVRVEYVAALQKPPKPLPKETPPEKKGFDFEKYFPYAILLVSALILAFGVNTVARSLRAASVSLVDGFLNMNSKVKSEEDAKRKAEKEKEEGEDGKIRETAMGGATLNRVGEPDTHTLKVLREIIREQPVLLSRTITEDAADLIGLRHLLPYLEDNERALLHTAIGKQRLQKMWEIALDQKIQGQSFDEFNAWLHGLAEKLTIRKLQGGSPLEQIVGNDRAIRLVGSNPEKLFEQAKGTASKGAWRVAVEFLPKDFLTERLRALTASELDVFLSSAGAGNAEISTAADQLLRGLDGAKVSVASAEIGQSPEDRQIFYSTHMLEPLVELVQAKPLGEDELLIRRISSLSIELGRLVQAKLWTVDRLREVPDAYLERRIKTITNEERAAMVLALPKEHSERFRALIPDGTGRAIVLDMVKQALAKTDAERDRKNAEYARKFLRSLKTDYDAKKFDLQQAGTATRTAA